MGTRCALISLLLFCDLSDEIQSMDNLCVTCHSRQSRVTVLFRFQNMQLALDKYIASLGTQRVQNKVLRNLFSLNELKIF